MVNIYRKEGWTLNPNDKIVNAILKRIEHNAGECPCENSGKLRAERLCPCKDYVQNDICHCTLYIRKNENQNQTD